MPGINSRRLQPSTVSSSPATHPGTQQEPQTSDLLLKTLLAVLTGCDTVVETVTL